VNVFMDEPMPDLSARVEAISKREDEIADLVELAESAPNLALAVVDTEDTTDINVWNESMTVLEPVVFYRVVKMGEA